MMPAMTITIGIEGGPTVCLAYDPHRAEEQVPAWTRQSELLVPGTTVSIRQQPPGAPGLPASSWLWNVLADAGTYCLPMPPARATGPQNSARSAPPRWTSTQAAQARRAALSSPHRAAGTQGVRTGRSAGEGEGRHDQAGPKASVS